jgi:formylglycine-generating enzyme required for sulfatase activity
MGNSPSSWKGGNNYPVEQLSWEDVQEFVNRLNNQTGRNYRLPTKAEWEYGARSGGKKEKYAGTSPEDEFQTISSCYDKLFLCQKASSYRVSSINW